MSESMKVKMIQELDTERPGQGLMFHLLLALVPAGVSILSSSSIVQLCLDFTFYSFFILN